MIAIITPVYVSPEFPSRLTLFDRCVSSVHKLPSAHLHVIVDDGSPDPDGIQRVLKKYDDRRIRYLRRERKKSDLKTASNALNFGIDAVLKGHETIAAVTPLHSDDLMFDIASRANALEPADVGAALGPIAIDRQRRRIIHQPDFSLSARDYVARGIAPYPVSSIMWKPEVLAGMKTYNQETLRIDGVYHPDFVNVEDVLVAKLTALYLCNAGLRIAVSEELSMAYRDHDDSLRGYHQDSRRGKTRRDLWNLNVARMQTMYYETLAWDHVNP
ncbi:MAG TPA: glycosyltransferase [Thermoanaerobaculia bacterium]|nr:glycosyltransferase [Thermoanaerobaculia bacterium]